jgi:hypothetical protein
MIEKEVVLTAAKTVAERILNGLNERPPILDHQIFQTLMDEVSAHGDVIPIEMRDILVTIIGVLIARERMAQESENMGDRISSENFGRISRGTAH